MRLRAFKEKGISIIEDVSRIITGSVDPAESLHDIAKLIADRFYVDVCSIYIFNGERNCLSLAATAGLSEDSVGNICMSLDEGLTGLVLEEMKPVYVNNPARHPRYKYFEGSGEEKYHSYLGLPIVYHGEALGVFVIQTVEENLSMNRIFPYFQCLYPKLLVKLLTQIF